MKDIEKHTLRVGPFDGEVDGLPDTGGSVGSGGGTSGSVGLDEGAEGDVEGPLLGLFEGDRLGTLVGCEMNDVDRASRVS